MSNKEQLEATRYGILSLVNILGVANHAQISSQNIVHAKRLSQHMDRLVAASCLDELSARAYYGNAKGRPSPVYRLTETGAAWLRSRGHESARSSGLKGDEAINHALAVLDCRLTLARNIPRANIATDRSLNYSQSVIRPDNLLVFKDGKRPLMVESEALGSLKRIKTKVQHLTDFFLSDVGADYGSDIRIVYLWRLSEHKRALALWQEACFSERQTRNLSALPFRPIFMAHADFLRYALLEAERYESLPTVTSEPSPAVAPEPTLPTSDSLDEATLKFLRDFREMNVLPIHGAVSKFALLRLIQAFILSRGEDLCEDLSKTLPLLFHPSSNTAAAYAMEDVAALLLRGMGIAAMATDAESYNSPVAFCALGDGRARPTLTVRVNPTLAQHLLIGWEGGGDDLGKTLSALFAAIFTWPRELDIAPLEEDKGR